MDYQIIVFVPGASPEGELFMRVKAKSPDEAINQVFRQCPDLDMEIEVAAAIIH